MRNSYKRLAPYALGAAMMSGAYASEPAPTLEQNVRSLYAAANLPMKEANPALVPSGQGYSAVTPQASTEIRPYDALFLAPFPPRIINNDKETGTLKTQAVLFPLELENPAYSIRQTLTSDKKCASYLAIAEPTEKRWKFQELGVYGGSMIDDKCVLDSTKLLPSTEEAILEYLNKQD